MTLIILSSSYVPFSNYQLFKKIDSIVPDHHGLYSGDYWLVWPTVLRDMMSGDISFGLTFRGIGNQEKAKAFVEKQNVEKGYFSVLCINDDQNSCKNKISQIVGPVAIERVIYRNKMVSELILTK